MVCGTAALRQQQASTAVQQLVFENRVFKITYKSSNIVVVMYVAVHHALFGFDTVFSVIVVL